MLGLDFIKANRAAVDKAIRDKGVDLDLDELLGARRRGARRSRPRSRRCGPSAMRSAPDSRARRPRRRPRLGARAKEAGAQGRRARRRAGREGSGAQGADAAAARTSPMTARRSGRTRASTRSSAPRARRPKFGFEPLDHVALIEKNDWADLSRITQVSGSRTYCLKGRLALLETKLMGWALEKIAEAGFTPITVPAIAREQAFLNQGQFPGHKEETYELPNDDLWLAGTAEVALTSLHSGEIIEARQIADPLRRLFALLPPRGGQRRQGRARAAARPPVRQGRAICDLRGRRRAVGRLARAAARAGREPACRRSKSPTR